MKETVLVTGATGRRGGAVASRLLVGGWGVRALTRDPSGPKAWALAARGAEVVQGSLAEPADVERVVKGAYGVFSVQAGPVEPEQDEAALGKELADAALRHGVRHLVYSSTLGADRWQPAKWEVEEHIRRIGVSAAQPRR
ncbi:NmrA family NAD(P)-binding protein [Amycolatopsis suaedae]|uniref:NmrA family NAD(P)-binding protein n=1 Tax=Amycolatopsis suaedae TaxID=2510978 RepID=UPI00196A5A7A|nr:NmrA family NAD(P)-binding protein [Amycolatopsis suaedae]